LKVKLRRPTLSRSHIEFPTIPQHLARSPMFPVRAPILPGSEFPTRSSMFPHTGTRSPVSPRSP
jgi:hypothetical protein